jgi:hypothetical protein
VICSALRISLARRGWNAVILLVWNIQNGRGMRLPHIVEEIAAYDPDVVAVTEFRAGPGVTPFADVFLLTFLRCDLETKHFL